MSTSARLLPTLVVPAVLLACGSSPNGRAPVDGGITDGAAHADSAATDVGAGDSGGDMLSLPPVAALRLVAPLSTSTVTSQRPTLRWVLDPTCDGAHVQICRDRACTHEVVSFDATGASGAPTTALPKGVFFWRAYGRSGSTIVEGWTPTWEFTVGARSAPVDTSWGTTLDVNGDGYADVAIGVPGANGYVGQVDVYLGGASGIASSARLALTAPTGPTTAVLGLFLASAGDVNGDGYADLIVGGVSAAYLFLGGRSGLATTPAAIPVPQQPQTGVRVASAGDVDGDGYADVVLANFDRGVAYVYLGGPSGLAATPASTLPCPVQSSQPNVGPGFGHSVASAGDLNGDGYGDIVIGAPYVGQAFVYLGGSAGVATSPDLALAGPAGTSAAFGNSVSGADDVDGDGYADLLIGADSADGAATGDLTGRAYVFRGGASGVAATPEVTLLGSQTGGAFGRWVSRAGDVNGDGYADVIIGADGEGGADRLRVGVRLPRRPRRYGGRARHHADRTRRPGELVRPLRRRRGRRRRRRLRRRRRRRRSGQRSAGSRRRRSQHGRLGVRLPGERRGRRRIPCRPLDRPEQRQRFRTRRRQRVATPADAARGLKRWLPDSTRKAHSESFPQTRRRKTQTSPIRHRRTALPEGAGCG